MCDLAQADSVTECGSAWHKMAFVSHPGYVTTAPVPPRAAREAGTHHPTPRGCHSSSTEADRPAAVVAGAATDFVALRKTGDGQRPNLRRQFLGSDCDRQNSGHLNGCLNESPVQGAIERSVSRPGACAVTKA